MLDVSQLTESELQHYHGACECERDRLQKQQLEIIGELHKLRQRAKETSLIAQSTRTPIAHGVIESWQAGIKEAQVRLEACQGELGVANKKLRALRAASKPAIKSLAQLPGSVTARSNPETIESTPANGEINLNPKAGRVLFLQFFHQLVGENIDPRLVAVLEKDAHSLVDQYRSPHRGESNKTLS